jgi:hypothetical protein
MLLSVSRQGPSVCQRRQPRHCIDIDVENHWTVQDIQERCATCTADNGIAIRCLTLVPESTGTQPSIVTTDVA